MFLLVLILLGPPIRAFSDTLIVTSDADSGPGSLREAVATAAAGDTIIFQLPLPAVITLFENGISIEKSLSIIGPGPNSLTIVFSGESSVLAVGPGMLDVTISGLRVTGTEFFTFEGGGLFNASTGLVDIQDCVFDSNFAIIGGGVANEGSMSLTACTVSNNFVEGGESGGGGVYNAGTMAITGCAIIYNRADGLPGGLPLIAGGGILNNGTLSVVNTTLSANSTIKGYGGGIANSEGSLTITSCTITENNAEGGSGGGIYNSASAPGEIHLQNSIIAANTNGVELESDINGVVISDGYNLIGSNFETMVNPATGDQIGTPDILIDPLLGPLQDNGGPTMTHALLFGSPALDQGSSFGLTTDQRGRPRPVERSPSRRRKVATTATSARLKNRLRNRLTSRPVRRF